ncbi:MAG: hypothetical protein RL497_2056 [Pseudomonadota bacterium]|jgi:hypothetical protein
MNTPFTHKTLAFVALVLWLFASWGGVHSHWCFDGQEVPVSVHVDHLSDHDEHSDVPHQDVDVGLSELTLAKKLFGVDVLFLCFVFWIVWVLARASAVVFGYSLLPVRRFFGWRPPLRAPPMSSS